MNHQWTKINLVTRDDGTDLWRCSLCYKEQATTLGFPAEEGCLGYAVQCSTCEWWKKLFTPRARKTCQEQGYKGHNKCSSHKPLPSLIEALEELRIIEELEGEPLICSSCGGLKWTEHDKPEENGAKIGDYLRVYRDGNSLRNVAGQHLRLGTVIEGKMYCFRCRPCKA